MSFVKTILLDIVGTGGLIYNFKMCLLILVYWKLEIWKFLTSLGNTSEKMFDY